MATVSNAVAKVDNSPTGLMQQYKTDFTTVLPSHIKGDQWLRVALGALRKDKRVAQAAANDTGQFMGAMLNAARLGLEPGTEQFYLVPQAPKKGAPEVIMGVVGYQGLVELMYRAGAVSSVIVECVFQHDKFSYVPGRDERPIHEIDWDRDNRGDLRLVYAYAVMKDGATSKVVVMNRSDIDRIKGSSRSAHSEYSPWVKHEPAMWMKTAARQLAKWVPTSAEYMREQLRAVRDVQAETAGDLPAGPSFAEVHDGVSVDQSTGEILDGEVVEDYDPRDES